LVNGREGNGDGDGITDWKLSTKIGTRTVIAKQNLSDPVTPKSQTKKLEADAICNQFPIKNICQYSAFFDWRCVVVRVHLSVPPLNLHPLT